ncbi:RNA recognition motif domain-containing protein [Vibrio parahaemolyticus]|uniref:RNA recognition motif domain-containing protein n=1 Tax=Vibrio parahaemolyticus TaxID=670 RepID=UPI0004450530|nr:RNA-binding protein [Vibrio parahaemolyticus]ETZ10394.1 RNA recognition motif family protein [Vibrio parahaemolyticus M0605]EKB3552033.1 RNA-binding protein [Vibrio parahaemolyticus]EKB3555559.1 RNA-binding protein [Vibrio parahaemolyticus]MBD6964414.1 RNA-binding protein [Vibrio parahaemolyticus]HBC3827767.1 RNA-binding protein [Vibrio parahaemolyticus]
MKLLVRNLARHMTEQDIRKLFSVYGKVELCSLVLDQETGLSKGFGFVIMPDEAEAISALEALNLTNVEKSKIRVKVAQD